MFVSPPNDLHTRTFGAAVIGDNRKSSTNIPHCIIGDGLTLLDLFEFRREIDVVSLSQDGVEPPKIYIKGMCSWQIRAMVVKVLSQ